MFIQKLLLGRGEPDPQKGHDLFIVYGLIQAHGLLLQGGGDGRRLHGRQGAEGLQLQGRQGHGRTCRRRGGLFGAGQRKEHAGQ